MKTLLTIFFFASVSAFAQEAPGELESFAKFPEGIEKFYEYLDNNLVYPADALRDKVAGVVYVDFLVLPNGQIDPESVEIVEGLTRSCDNEAERLIKNSPTWIPARQNGVPVQQTVRFPVAFTLPE
jgi:periplasmic protein TonB